MERRKFLKQAIVSAAGSALIPGIVAGRSLWEEQPPLIIDTKVQGRTFSHLWSKCVGAGRAGEVLRAGSPWLEHLQFGQKHCGFQYCRLHGIFHDDMSVYQGGVYNWLRVDDVINKMLKAGVKPFVELSFFPKEIAGGTSTAYWWKANVSPPGDFSKWSQLVTNFAKHCIEKFGIAEVSSWYFEVWNEPNVRTTWDGSKSQYFAMYKATAQALKTVSPQLRVGGPATSNFVGDGRFDGEAEDKSKISVTAGDPEALKWKGVWIEDFLEYCKQQQLPVDFVSTHPYPTDIPFNNGKGMLRGVDATLKDLQWLRAVVDKSAFPKAEIHLSEWGTSSSARDAMHDALPTTAYIVKANVDCIGLADGMAYWNLTDSGEEGSGAQSFSGGNGLLNYQGIAKPSFHAYRMLHTLGDELLYNKDGIVVTRHKASQRLTAIVYNYPSTMKTVPPFGDTDVVESALKQGEPRDFNFKLLNTNKDARFNVEILDRENGNALNALKQAGNPDALAGEQLRLMQLRAMAVREEQVLSNNMGVLLIGKTLQPWDVMLIDETH
ncbi:GH39 family glycosyl hydrolase [Chitinophaga pinensis]|uniref:Glycoside hydrolase n=1 Tax=Chitinophaga pinensis TaxID=79329 RepID=A0A5C6LW68_9BACT|nr:glycoside hydrolase [Chitinophaga pinensis]TWW00780.1 glycoside hydrolase [Chitinophaga pinensis]